MVVFILFVLGKKYPFWTNLVQKSNCQFKLKFCTKINLNLQNSMMIFIFFCLRLEIPFLANLVQKIKIVCLSWNLVPLEYAEFNGRVHVFCLDRKYLFWANLFVKIKIVSLSWNLISRLYQICKIRFWCSLFWFRTFLQVLSEKLIWHFDGTWLTS